MAIKTGSSLSYYWLSDTELLLCNYTKSGYWTLTRRDTLSGQDTPMLALSALLTRTGGHANTIRLSPDGNWVLWSGTGKMIQAATLDGQRTSSWALQSGETWVSYWLADSRHFARYTSHGKYSDTEDEASGVLVRDVNHPKEIRRLPMSIDETSNPGDVTALQRPGWTIYAEEHVGPATPPAIMVSAFGPSAAHRRYLYVTPPPGVEDEWAVQSLPWYASKDDRLLWLLQTPPHKPLAVWRAVLGWLHLRPQTDRTASLQVSHLNGRGLHEVGDWRISVVTDNIDFNTKNGDEPHDFRWLPGGRSISFVAHELLYTVPAD